MWPTIRDLETGIEVELDSTKWDRSEYWWTEGGGSCDCSRAAAVDKFYEMDTRLRVEHPDLLPHQAFCYGCKRFIVTDFHGDLEGCSKEDLLERANIGYRG